MQITSPTPGTTVSGIVSIYVDAPGIKQVNFYVNGVLKARDKSAPFKFDWYTTNYDDGTYNVRAVASSGKFSVSGNYVVKNSKPAPTYTTTISLTGTPQVGKTLTAVVTCQ